MENRIKYPKEAGIYKLTCNNNQKIYIGKSINLDKRLTSHRLGEKRIKGRWYFENAMIKHGWDSFTVEILEIFENFDKLKDNRKLLDLETHYIKLFDSGNKDKGYNIQKHSNDGAGIPKKPFTEEHRAKLRAGRAKQIRGPISEETRKKLRRPKSQECKEKLRKLRLGKTNSVEHKEKLRLSRLGKSHSEDAKEKIRQSKIGNTHSEETKEKMRVSKLGKSHTLEHREKIRLTKEQNRLSKLNE